MTPNLVLKIYKSRGMDLYDKVVYRPGQAILSHQNQSDATHLVNEVLVEGGDKLLAIATNSVSQTAYGRREGYLSASNIQSGLSEYGQAYLSRAAFPTWRAVQPRRRHGRPGSESRPISARTASRAHQARHPPAWPPWAGCRWARPGRRPSGVAAAEMNSS